MEESKETLKKLKKKGIDLNNLQSEDFKTLIDMYIKGQFENENIRDYLKESNVTFKTFFDGIGAFVETHKTSSNKYIETLDDCIKDLRRQAESAETDEQKEKIYNQIKSLLDKIKEEVNANRSYGEKLVLMTGSVALALAGGALYLATRNPEVLKKGVETIAQETVKRIT